jgi:beta-lactamase class A
MEQRFEKFTGVYAAYFQFLPTGEEIGIDADTAFSGMSTVKLGVLLMTYMDNDLPLPDNITKWISITITSPTASNAAANALMYHLGDGDVMKGVREVSEFYQSFGLKNTFISTPYNSDVVPYMKRTPANTNPEYNTNLDPAMQTTPRDMGVLLAEIGRCAEGKGSLLAAYADKLSPEKCQELIWWLEQNPLGHLIKYGVPEGTKIGHKHGYAPDTQGDVAIIYGPEGPYVLTIYVYQYGWVVWDMSNPLMGDVSRLVWNYFLFRTGQEQLPPPVYDDAADVSQ